MTCHSYHSFVGYESTVKINILPFYTFCGGKGCKKPPTSPRHCAEWCVPGLYCAGAPDSATHTAPPSAPGH